MKKLIAIAVVFALAAGGVFAADIGATIFSGVDVIQGSTTKQVDPDDPTKEKGSDITGSGAMYRVRLEGSGENDDGNFGAWIRVEGAYGEFYHEGPSWAPGPYVGNGFNPFGLAWWKPIDQFKLTIGGNPDGIYGKEGYAGWMFYQMPSDVGIVNPGNVWGGGYIKDGIFRDAFFGGFGDNGLMLDIKPVDMLGINIILPYFDGGKVGDIFKHMTLQVDLNLDFGNIALTYDMDTYAASSGDKIGGRFHLYFGLSAIDNLSLDLGIGFPLPESDGGYKRSKPIAIGLAAKFDVNDTFGFKARLLAEVAGKTVNPGYEVKDPMVIGVDLLPYIGISDSLKVFIGLGLSMWSPDVGDSVMGWHFNPYLQVGQEWGPTFYAGIRVWSSGEKALSPIKLDEYKPINFAIPIGIQVSF